MNESQMSGKSLSVKRIIRATPEAVFAAWTQPELLRTWWRCESGWTTPVAEMDLKVGGKYRLGMQDPDKDDVYVVHGEFLDVVPPRKLVYTWEWESPTEHPGQSRVTVEFNDGAGGTELVITHEGFETESAADGHNIGWNACLAVFDLLWTDDNDPRYRATI